MIDHLTLTVRDVAKSRAFYEKALAPLGYRVLMEFEGMCGFGDEKPYLWMKQGDPTNPIHLAFAARRQADVRAFYEAAMDAGGRDNGGPGLRKEYHPTYYGAFVYDPDGHPIEAVCHREERAVKAPLARGGEGGGAERGEEARRQAPARSGPGAQCAGRSRAPARACR